MTDRYISVKALKNKLNYIFRVCGTSNVVKEAVKEAINRLPSADVVEVVRCKDCCKYSGKYCLLTDDTEDRREPDDYCSYGERREE